MKTMMENELNPLYSAEVRARMEPAGFRTLVSFEEKLEATRAAARQVERHRPGLRIIGACVYGSYMKGLETRLSDNDVLLIMQDKRTKAFKAAGGDIATQNLDRFIEKLSTSCVYVGALLSPYFLTTPDYRGLFGALTVNPYQLQVRMNRIIFEAVRSYRGDQRNDGTYINWPAISLPTNGCPKRLTRWLGATCSMLTTLT